MAACSIFRTYLLCAQKDCNDAKIVGISASLEVANLRAPHSPAQRALIVLEMQKLKILANLEPRVRNQKFDKRSVLNFEKKTKFFFIKDLLEDNTRVYTRHTCLREYGDG